MNSNPLCPPAQRILVTCDPASEAFALEELREGFPDLPPPQWLDDGLALIAPGLPFDIAADVLYRASPIFVQHLAPVALEVPLQADESDIETLRKAVAPLTACLSTTRSFAVQTRILGEGKLPYRRYTINTTLSETLAQSTGATVAASAPEDVVSLLCTPTVGYLGVSPAVQNRSDWPGGEQRFRREEGQISRAEFKLLEAFDVFGLTLPERGTALDLGAAPGGWTRVLRMRGLDVVAVDPADLDGRLRRDRSIFHIRKKAEEYLPSTTKRFGLLVNDMRMDALDAAEITLMARKVLLPDALAILTLKLPSSAPASRSTLKNVRLCLERLSREYTIIGARQLHHNRSEVTVVLRAK